MLYYNDSVYYGQLSYTFFNLSKKYLEKNTKPIDIFNPQFIWVGHVARMGEGRGVHGVLVGKP